MATVPDPSLSADELAALLTEARDRTALLVSPLTDEELRRQHDPLMSPIVWDLGHIAHFEEVWLLKNVESSGTGSEGLQGIYNPFENPRAVRDTLPLPSLPEARAYMAAVRRAVLEELQRLDLSASTPLLRDGYVFRMVLQHEYQHNETILQTLQLKQGRPYPAPRSVTVPTGRHPSAPDPGAMVHIPGGEVIHGTDDRTAAYDNERPAHAVTLTPFWMDAHPVTNGQYLAFMEDGGYATRDHWSDEGWAWLQDEGAAAPKYWEKTGQGWQARTMDRTVPVDPERPVCHVCYWEAEAFARWAGKRLPTEFEWEAAASWDFDAGAKRTYPWGAEAPSILRANLDATAFETAPVGTYPAGVSPAGCWGMLGDVWEWTATDFHGYPGYETFPYPEYSQVFFGTEYKVLRGASWATRPGATRNTFRNWDYPIRRQIFAGFRCARDD
ncbi:MAG: ergothioneine biosynthesis protein EgtB [Gemmatimonadota bacterium]